MATTLLTPSIWGTIALMERSLSGPGRGGKEEGRVVTDNNKQISFPPPEQTSQRLNKIWNNTNRDMVGENRRRRGGTKMEAEMNGIGIINFNNTLTFCI